MIKLKQLLEQAVAAAFNYEAMAKKYKFTKDNSNKYKNLYKALPAMFPNINFGEAYKLLRRYRDSLPLNYINQMLKGRAAGGMKFDVKLGVENLKQIINDINTYYAALDAETKEQISKKQQYLKIDIKKSGELKVKTGKPEPEIFLENPGPIMGAENESIPDFFPDDGAIISSNATAYLNNLIKGVIDKQRASLPDGAINIEFGARFIEIQAGTSQVPTKFGGTEKDEKGNIKYSQENNIKLCEARGQSMLKTVQQLLKANNVIGYEDCVNGGEQHFVYKMTPNGGDPWTNKERNDTATYGTSGNRTAAYEAKYGKPKFAQCQIALTCRYQTVVKNPGDPEVFTGTPFDVKLSVRGVSKGGGGGRTKKCRIFCKGFGFKPKYKPFKQVNTFICPAFDKRRNKL